MKNKIEVTGKRLSLRDLAAADLPRVTRWLKDPDTAYLMGTPENITLERQKKWFAAMRRDPARVVAAVTIKKSGRHIGNVALSDISARDSRGMLNIFIGDPADRRKGYALEAMDLFLFHCFARLELNRVWLIVHEENEKARGLYSRAGLKAEGLLRSHERYAGHCVDKVVMAILADEYFALPDHPGFDTFPGR